MNYFIWNFEAKKFESISPLGSIFIYIVDFFINLQMTTE